MPFFAAEVENTDNTNMLLTKLNFYLKASKLLFKLLGAGKFYFYKVLHYLVQTFVGWQRDTTQEVKEGQEEQAGPCENEKDMKLSQCIAMFNKYYL